MAHIKAVNISKRYIVRKHKIQVFNNLSFHIKPKEKIAIIGKNGAGKSTLIRLISGQERPTSGYFDIAGLVSWPMGASNNLSENLTGHENIQFIADLFNISGNNRSIFIRFVKEFSGLKEKLEVPIRIYSSGMRAKLAISLSYAIKFDYYLADEVLAVGDSKFSSKCLDHLKSITNETGLIFVSHNEAQVKDFCDRCILLSNGRKIYDGDVDEGFKIYNQLPA